LFDDAVRVLVTVTTAYGDWATDWVTGGESFSEDGESRFGVGVVGKGK